MKLHSPFLIGSRLLPSLKVGDGTLSLEFVGVRANRCVYRWYVDIPAGEFSKADLTGRADDLQGMFGAFLSFLSASAEAYHYTRQDGAESENSNLFPLAVAEWAVAHSDEIDMLRYELEESGAVLIED